MAADPSGIPAGRGRLARDRETLLRLAAALLGVIALVWLSYEIYRLVCRPAWIGDRPIHPGGIDFDTLRRLSRAWFQGRPVYAESGGLAIYPPAGYPLLWVLLGWLPAGWSKLLWGSTAVACLAWLARFAVRQSGADTTGERALMALVPLSMYATGATIGNGQITIHLVAALAGGLLLSRDPRRAPGRAALGSALLLASLVKPTLSVPFFWIVLFSTGASWPAMVVIAGYLGLSGFAASFQQAGLPELTGAWLRLGADMAAGAGESNLHLWLSKLGLASWGLPASLLALGISGLWVFRNRRGDPWVMAGVTAVVARLWTYHRWYDDLLLLFTLVALFRVIKGAPAGRFLAKTAGVMFALTLASTLAPGGLYVLPASWTAAFTGAQSAVWLGAMVTLAIAARLPVFARWQTAGSAPSRGGSTT